jgi:hypothetical protein
MSTLRETEPADPQQLQKTLFWALPTGFLIMLSLVVMLGGGKPEIPPARHGSYDPGDSGARAAYLLLQELGFKTVPSKQVIGGQLRWTISPQTASRQFEAIPGWINTGGKLLLADEKMEISNKLGLNVTSQSIDRNKPLSITVNSVTTSIAPGATVIASTRKPDRTWPAETKLPLCSIYTQGRGEIWLVHYPEMMRNDVLKSSLTQRLGNGYVLQQLAKAMQGDSRETIWFDEYHHGMRQQPSIWDLLLEPPLLWVTLQGLLFLGLALWHYAPRFGTYQEQPVARRRSKEEYLQALASMLERKHAGDVAVETVRRSVRKGLTNALSLPADVPHSFLIEQALTRWPGKLRPELLQSALIETLPSRASEADFLRLLHQLEALRDVYESARPAA